MGIPCKTAAGHAELLARERSLSQRHRTVLLLVDGRRSVEEVVRLARQQGVSSAYLDELLALGLVVLAARLNPPAAPPPDSHWPVRDSATGFAPDTIGLGPPISDTQLATLDDRDLDVAEARRMLLQALFTQAPVSGAVTMLRVRRARSRTDLQALLPEVQARLSRPQRLADARALIARVERLLAG